MARQTGAQKADAVRGSVGGRLVRESGPDADPVLAMGEGVADGRDVRRADYWSSNLLANFSALIGFGGGLAIGLSAQAAIGFMLVVWGLTAVATGRMMIPRRFMGSKVYLGRAARLTGLGIVALGAFMLVRYGAEPSPFAGVVPDYDPPLGRFFKH
ncbi:MAG: hypothetical protein JNJ73_09315 [Hyphomonadaceae bacterium]|nr:hypothetical protein [Hyphomonadaceae bacterium]